MDGLHHECHVQSELAHGLHAFLVADNLTGGGAVGNAPVLRWYNGHVRLQKILVQHVHRRCGSTTAGDAHRGSHLHRPVCMQVGIEQTVEQRQQRAVRRREIDGRADEKSVGRAHLLGNLIDYVTKSADSRRPAFIAGDAAVNLQMSYVNPLRLDALLLQGPLHFVQRRRRIAVRFRAAIKNYYFHSFIVYILPLEIIGVVERVRAVQAFRFPDY